MKSNVLLFILIFILFSNCNSNDYGTELIGKWSLIKHPQYGLKFTKDSLFFESLYPTKQNWSADKNNIYLKNITDLKLNKLGVSSIRNHFIYSLNKGKDTLTWRSEKDSTKTYYKFIRVKNKLKPE